MKEKIDSRNGKIPSWAKVSGKFGLNKSLKAGELPPGDYSRFLDFYKSHAILATGQLPGRLEREQKALRKEGQESLESLFEKRGSEEFEERHKEILTKIVSFVNQNLKKPRKRR